MTTLAHLRKAALALPGTAERATRTAAVSFLLAVTATAALGWTAVSRLVAVQRCPHPRGVPAEARGEGGRMRAGDHQVVVVELLPAVERHLWASD
ncbi:hypothetical protein [Streptomyces sp. NPDC002490]|uniref:hypothetical protein n=1 Tax=Streptomyces sp. NPDC002490 TaxID=3154416 RepID=UPI00332C6FE7